MIPPAALVTSLKHLFNVLVILFWLIYVIFRFVKSRWSLFKKKEHLMPERLDKEFKHKFVELSEVRIHYVEEGDKSKPLLLLIHGFPEFWYSWRFQLKHFAQTHHVVAIDQRGYGESERPREKEKYAPKILAKDIKELIEKLGHKKAVLAGHDWGGAVAWFTTLTYPDIVDKLIVLNCPHPGAYLSWKAKKQILKSWHLLFFQAPWIPEITLGFNDYETFDYAYRSEYAGLKNQQNFTDEDLAAWKATFSKHGALNAPINYYRALPGAAADLKAVLRKKAEPPTLIIWGENDPFLLTECAELSNKLCRDGKVEYVSNSSHWVQQDQPERVNEIIEQFIS